MSPSRADAQSQREAVVRSAAQYLVQHLRDGTVVAVSHGRDSGEVPRFFHPGHQLDCTFVSAMGGSLVGIGGTDDGCTMVRNGCLSVDEIARLRSAGAVGDVLGNYVDVEGRLIESPHRLVALSLEQLERIETVIAVVSEVEKPRAILGTLRAGVIDVLIVDAGNARAVLEMTQAVPDAQSGGSQTCS